MWLNMIPNDIITSDNTYKYIIYIYNTVLNILNICDFNFSWIYF